MKIKKASAPFKPGQKVVFLDDDLDPAWKKYRTPEKGKTYTVRGVKPYWEDAKDWGVLLEEVVNEERWFSGLGTIMEPHFRAMRFQRSTS